MNLTVIRYVVAGAIALVLVALLLVIALAILRGADINSSQLISLFAFVGVLIGMLGGLVGTHHVAGAVADVRDKINGHLQQHIGHTDDQVQLLIDRRLRELGTGPSLVQTPPDVPQKPPGAPT